jgi:GAF domain-containing protein
MMCGVWGTVRDTAVVTAAAILATAASALWNDNAGEASWLLALVVVAAGGAFAIAGARARTRASEGRRRLGVLAAIAGVADGELPFDETAAVVADLIVPSIADLCVVDVVQEDTLRRVRVRAAGPEAAQIEAGYRRRTPAAVETGMGAAVVVDRHESQLFAEVTDDALRKSAHDEQDLALLRSTGLRSTMVVPLRSRGRVLGALTLSVTKASGRRYGPDDLAFAETMAGRVALALDNAGLFSDLQTLEAQTAAALGSLADAVTIQSPTGRLVYANEAAARMLGFPTASDLLATPPQRIIDEFESFGENGNPITLDDLPGRRALAGLTPRPTVVRAIHRTTGEERWRLVKATPVLDKAGRPRLAVNVIADITDVRRADRAQRLLVQAGEALSSSLDYEETLGKIARLAVPDLADWAGVTIPGSDGFLRQVAVAHVDPAKEEFARDFNARYPSRVEDPTGAAEVMRTGKSQLVGDIPDEMLARAIPDPERLAALRSIGMRAAMLVPMPEPGGRAIGALTFVSAESGRTFSPEDLALAEELGRRAGIAVHNARLHTERTAIARTLQAGLLPDPLPAVPGVATATLYRPAGKENWVGGDFYEGYAVGDGWMFAIGDVAGRGAPAAAVTALARHTLRAAATLTGSPTEALRKLNLELLARHRTELVTVACVLVRPSPSGADVTVWCAGHPPPLRIAGGEATQAGRYGPVLGAFDAAEWSPVTVRLEGDDVLLLFTDGVLDAEGPDDRFGEDRLAAAVGSATSPAEAIDRLTSSLDAFQEGEQADDTAAVAIGLRDED